MEYTYKEMRAFAVDFAYYIYANDLSTVSHERYKEHFDDWIKAKLPQMTEYERLVKEEKMSPMTGLDGLLIGEMVEDIISGRSDMYDELLEAIESMDLEIEYLFREEQEKLNKLNTIIEKYKNK